MSVDTVCMSLPPEKADSGDGEIQLKAAQVSSQEVVAEVMNDIIDRAFEVITKSSPSIEKITPLVVGDILENILSKPSTGDETVLLDDEIKQIIKEMKYPPDTKGLGDQSEVKSDQVLPEAKKLNTLERKNRLTNLVRNSKQMLAKLINSENEGVKSGTVGEANEKLLKIIDLEGNNHFMESGNEGILRIPAESALDMVELDSSMPNEGDEMQKVQKEENADKCANKKKWNIGMRILKCFRRNHEEKKGEEKK